MTRLFGVELSRVLARRLVRLFMMLALLGIVVAGVVAFFASQDLGPEEARAAVEQERSAFFSDCELFPAAPGDAEVPPAGTPERRAFCEQVAAQDLVAEDPRFRLTELPEILRVTTVFMVIIGWLLAASMIGAEWRAGTITTALTWEPRRARLLLVKAASAAVFAAGFTIAFQSLLAGALSPTAIVRGTTEGAGIETFREIAGVVLRGAGLAAVGALIGFAVGHIGRNTAVALGAGFVYLAVLEGGIVGGVFPGIRRWLMVGNAIVFIGGPSDEVAGRSVAGAGLLLALYGVGAVAAAVAVFRARDVT